MKMRLVKLPLEAQFPQEEVMSTEGNIINVFLKE